MDSSSSDTPRKTEIPINSEELVCHIKALGIFDQFRKECLADVDTRPAYHNLIQRVDGYSSKFLSELEWMQEINKNSIRDNLRKYINGIPVVINSLDHLVDQVVIPKAYNRFLPRIESETKKYIEAMEKLQQAPENLTVGKDVASEGDSSSNEATSSKPIVSVPQSPLLSVTSVTSPPNSDSPHSLIIVEDGASQDSMSDSEVGNQVAITLTSLADTVSSAPVLESEDGTLDSTPPIVDIQTLEPQEKMIENIKVEFDADLETIPINEDVDDQTITVKIEPIDVKEEYTELEENIFEQNVEEENVLPDIESPNYDEESESKLIEPNNEFLSQIVIKEEIDSSSHLQIKEEILPEIPSSNENEAMILQPTSNSSRKIKLDQSKISDPSRDFRRQRIKDKISEICKWIQKPEDYSSDDDTDTEFLENVFGMEHEPNIPLTVQKTRKLSSSKPASRKRKRSGDQDDSNGPSKRRRM